ncbi:hypothetical protein [Hymenobacter seoulensis]
MRHEVELSDEQQLLGTVLKPTLSQRVVNYQVEPSPDGVEGRCDVALVDGILYYATDCQHALRGQTLFIPIS